MMAISNCKTILPSEHKIQRKVAKQQKKKAAIASNPAPTVQHEVVWSIDDTDNSRLAVVVYLITRSAATHTLVFLPHLKCCRAIEAGVAAAGVSCSTLTSSADADTLKNFNTGYTKVLFTTDLSIKKKQITKLNMVIHYRIAGSAEQYRERVAKVGCGERLVSSSVVTEQDKPSLRELMQHTGYSFTQRTVLGDVLSDIREQLSSLQQQDSSSVSVKEEKSSCDAQHTTTTLTPAPPLTAPKPATVDTFYAELDTNNCSGLDRFTVRTASDKTRRKKKQRKNKQQQQRTENRLSDTDTDDDDDDDNDDGAEEQGRKPRKQIKGKSSRAAPALARKKRKSFTTALTDVGAKGVKKYRNALTFQEKNDYKDRTSNAP